MVTKLDMKSMSIAQENIKKISELFPNAVTEVVKDGELILAVDFEALKQEMSEILIEDKQERYQMSWPDKSKAKVLANSRITSTLRPDKEKSVDFDNTQNLYIEGDNLDVLKLLRETYLGKVKMIYIDPPYNTGNDFVYNDDFSQTSEEYMGTSGQYDEEGNRLVKNLESNGRFHTDWLNMIYPRLKVAKDLLSDDGVIFISIDDNEQSNLRRLCDEIWGSDNFVVQYIWEKHKAPKNDNKYVTSNHEYVIVYAKDKDKFIIKKDARDEENLASFKNEDNDPRGPWSSGPLLAPTFSSSTVFPIINPHGKEIYPPQGKCWSFNKEGIKRLLEDNRIWFGADGHNVPRIKRFLSELPEGLVPRSMLFHDVYGGNQKAANDLKKLFDVKKLFDYSKPIDLMKYFIEKANGKNEIFLDFFSGSATTAHAVMQLNAEDGGNRKFIMVQLPEECDEKSEAYKAGYKTICEIGEERIRRAGAKIKSENPSADKLDTGFRVLKLDSSNMQDVYYNPMAMRQSLLDETIDNVKSDRTPLDLLFQVMLDLGVELSAKIEEKQVNGKTYFTVNGNDIIACFDENIDNAVITEIAKQQPLYAVFKDKSFATDSVGINNEQLFKTYSPATVIKVL